MADRVYPASKPNPVPPRAANGGASFPATKAQSFQRPTYRPQPPKSRRSRRGLCCSIFLWLIVIVIALVFLAAIAAGVLYLIYRPHRPTFSVSSLRLSAFNVSSSGNLLTSALDLSVTARNPNGKIVFLYDPTSISVTTSGGVGVGDGSFPAFVHEAKNTTFLKTTVRATRESIDSSAAADLRKSSNLKLEIDLETKAGVKVGKLKTKKIGIRVQCNGIQVAVPKGKTAAAAAAAAPDAACKVKLRVKIWKWTL